MNQQRARRFRTALDAENAKEKAKREGVEMPKEEAFDSNCITPGTEFMAKLTKQLKYFINKKISEDSDWQGVEVVLSGHEVPGEGEHKVMEYIRLAKAQPDYDPNMRHCLYGLDADLIMLGLLSHDPHFCLLREEVTFGRQSQKKSKELEHQNFYLMHLCIVREYLELEFQELKEPSALSFPFDMERVIDDFILMAFFVGNDFLPNLPNLHINEGALALMFKMYKSVLPKAGGYINELGVINLERLALLLDELADVEFRFFEAEKADASWFKGKQMAKVDVMEKGSRKIPSTVTTTQKDVFRKVKKFVGRRLDDAAGQQASLDLEPTLPARDRKFVQGLADDLRLQWKTVEDAEGYRHMRLDFPETLDGDNDDEDEEESQIALLRVLKRYDSAKVVDVSVEEVQQQMDQRYEQEFQGWKNKYYKEKFDWGLENEEGMQRLTENYVQGLQWVLFYYYRGVASWPWFYGYHYSPMISGRPRRNGLLSRMLIMIDVKKGLKANMNFTLGQPFRPYQQLMGVLPDRSKRIVPQVYHDLMTESESPIIDFYPRDFELDKNGKKMDWEAVVKIPFIDEKRLLNAMGPRDPLLSQAEQDRNEFGVSLKFAYSPDSSYTYPSSLTGIFPDLLNCHCVENIFDLPTMDGLDLHVGLMEGVKLGETALAGFPSLKVLPHTGTLGFHSVNVFQQDSRNESMVVTMTDAEKRTKAEAAKARLGQRVHVGYPFLSEAKITRVSDEMFSYALPESGSGPPIATPHSPPDLQTWHKKAERIESVYSKRLGMIIGPVESLVHVDMLKGLKKTDDGASVKEYARIPGIETDYASQMVVDDVVSEDQRFIEKAALPIEEEFPIGTRAFFLGEFNYGRPLEVVGHTSNKANIWVSTAKGKPREFGREIAMDAERQSPYIPSYAVARMLSLSPLVLSKITSAFQVILEEGRINLGLNLKFEAKKLKVLGYSRRKDSGWEFSQKAIELIKQYMLSFPDFIAGIQRNPQGKDYDATDFYPEDHAKAKMKEIQAWLKSIESKNFQKVPLEAEQLDSETVQRIEQAADQAVRLDPPGAHQNKKINGVPRNALLKPSDAEHRLSHQRFTVGDRIVYVQDSGRVPIATHGTVVGKTRTPRTTLIDVVFDASFMSGTSLEGRCSPFRGSTVPVHALLNITDKQIIAGSRAGDNQRPQSVVPPLTVNGYGAPAGPNGQGQLIPAQVPAPLRGSFRGAVSGRQNGIRGGGMSRGRGGAGYDGTAVAPPQTLAFRNQSLAQPHGPRGRGSQTNGASSRGRGNMTAQQTTRGGYTKIDMNGSDEGTIRNNPSFRPQSYTNVAPPANLDSRERGRGRGGFRGGAPRGDGFRSRGAARGRGLGVVTQ